MYEVILLLLVYIIAISCIAIMNKYHQEIGCTQRG